ncbi:MAG TPA: uroporphyrinogen decarboxylase [Niabella sp.]|mgnify:CR=1 FL=1|nr:uroporphyrinogen decarboxylase [Niabella sp.]HOZ98039.1 uroporphyrinogen decarboxylase [Niabella sp.]HQW14816.1 uroporphyrinogen decarboxylase [Niabella sp.]HQX18559.1 uroporphyrinogen decarboxylase [Niabella sp.]HQX40779.1 uroporphyrinogen decarboxylase [Niabella sp.]
MRRDKTLKNDLIIRTLLGEKTERTPVWMMRQAGRYLPEYIKLREQYSFFERCQNPELACEITLQPVDIVGVDAAILFSDILVVPQAMGLEVQLIEKKGPLLPNPIKTQSDLQRIQVPDVNERLGYVFDAIKLIKQELNGRVPLIGFAGAPFTLLCYMVQGMGSKTFDEAKGFCFQQPALAHQLLQMITDTTIAYLKGQIAAGADTLQVFDSWGGLLAKEDFEIFSLQYIRQIVTALQDEVPVIIFAKGAWGSLSEMAATGAHGLGIDWAIEPQIARQMTGDKITLQGNFDPAKLQAPIAEIENSVKKMLKAFGKEKHIANLGHGILPNIPVDHAKAFVNAVKEYQW